MKIDHNPDPTLRALQESPKQASKVAKEEKKEASLQPSSAVQTHLSPEAVHKSRIHLMEASQIDALARGAADVREDKVMEMRARLQAGTLEAPAEEIAGKMLAEHLDLRGA
jgi:flagellar biosynthesis anti-sigma factor FlgM